MLFQKNDTVLFIGDSISDYNRARPAGEGFVGGLGTSYVSDAAALLQCAYPELALRFINVGTSGNTVRDLAARWDEDVLAHKPAWVSVLIGVNDVWRQFDCPQMPETHVSPDEYERTYSELIHKTLPCVKGMILMTPFYIEPNEKDAMRAAVDRYGRIVEALARKYEQTFVDLQAAWTPLLAHMHSTNIAWDRVHPNRFGHMQVARAFLTAAGFDWAKE